MLQQCLPGLACPLQVSSFQGMAYGARNWSHWGQWVWGSPSGLLGNSQVRKFSLLASASSPVGEETVFTGEHT